MSDDLRNIPAYAGRTGGSVSRSSWFKKHPRIRGENAAYGKIEVGDVETSPHTRGEPAVTSHEVLRGGNIPAYAGRTETNSIAPTSCKKHPRIRGENRNILNY